MPTDDVAREDVHLPPPAIAVFQKVDGKKEYQDRKKTIYSLDYHITGRGGLATSEKHASVREAEDGLATSDGTPSGQ